MNNIEGNSGVKIRECKCSLFNDAVSSSNYSNTRRRGVESAWRQLITPSEKRCGEEGRED